MATRGFPGGLPWWASLVGFPGGSEVKASAYNVRDLGSIPGLGRSPGEGNGNPLQYFCLENSMDGGAWWATAHGVTKSRTRLSDFTFLFPLSLYIVNFHLLIQFHFLQREAVLGPALLASLIQQHQTNSHNTHTCLKK